MNFLDLFIVAAIGFGAWRGFSKGLVIELFGFIALFLGLYGGIHFSDMAAGFLKESVGVESEYLPSIAFTITFLAIGAMVYFAGKTFEKLLKVARLSVFNRIGGAAFGAAKWMFIVGAIIVISESYDDKADILSDQTKHGSLLFKPVRDLTMIAIPAFTKSTIFLKNTLEDEELIPLKAE